MGSTRPFSNSRSRNKKKKGGKKKMNLSLVLSLLIPSLTGILKNGYISSDKEGIGRRQLLFFGIDSDGPWLVWDLQSRGPDFMLRNDNGRSARIRGREAEEELWREREREREEMREIKKTPPRQNKKKWCYSDRPTGGKPKVIFFLGSCSMFKTCFFLVLLVTRTRQRS